MRSLFLALLAVAACVVVLPTAALGRAQARTHCGVIRVAYSTGGHGHYRIVKRHTTCRRAKRMIRNFYAGHQHIIPGSGPEYTSPHAVRGGWRCGVAGGGVSCFKRHHRRPKPTVTAYYLN